MEFFIGPPTDYIPQTPFQTFQTETSTRNFIKFTRWAQSELERVTAHDITDAANISSLIRRDVTTLRSCCVI